MNSKLKATTQKDDASILEPKLRFVEFQNTGPWTIVSLASVAKINKEKVRDNTCIPMSITSGVGLVSQMEKFGRVIAGESYKNYLLLKKHDFAYNKSATKEYPEGYIALYTGEELAAVPNSIFTCFRIKGDSPVPQYLNYLFLGNLHGRWLRKFIEVGARAHGSLSIKDSDLMALQVPVPAGSNSLKEQEKIADCLASVDTLIEVQGRKVEVLRTHKKGLMQQLFPQEGESQPHLRFPEFEEAEEWRATTLRALIQLQSGFAFSSDFFGSAGKKLVTPKNFTQFGFGNFDVAITKYTTEEVPEKYVCRPGDLLVLLTDLTPTCELLGKPLEITDEDGVVLLNQRIARVEPISGDVTTSFLKQYFLTSPFNQVIVKTATGSTVKHSSNKTILDMDIILPHPAEQKRIADCLNSLDNLIAAETRKLDTLRTHKKGMMQQLFPLVAEE
ncbi:restriction endonuclease subunit S [Roseibium aggregatum]|uniref:restriction endonuclease subunit S n=1 Tax=Roseibium aggregatum TaxID=187304 RepID=UPI001E30E0A4|nr:restriction endonuclease subunit S [Roseibium aggregatum]UES51216.1 restriction endonuclease subunit S [Roseibium aggregatum]